MTAFWRELCHRCGANLGNDQWACAWCVTEKTVALHPEAKDSLDGRSWRYAPPVHQVPAATRPSS